MELIVFIGGLVVLDVLAMRFGVDSRILDVRDRQGWWPGAATGDVLHDSFTARHAQLRYEAKLERLASLASAGQPTLRLRLAHGLRALAARIEPAGRVAGTPAHART